jgi:rod shape determining protein RodA
MISLYRIKKASRRLLEVNRMVVIVVGLLCVLGLAMQYSASGGDIRVYALPQAMRFGVGVVLCAFVIMLPTRMLMQLAYPLYGLCLILLVVVEAMGFIGGGAQRWVNIGVFTLQPSEFMKIGVILAIARYFHDTTLEGTRHLLVLVTPIVLTLIPVALILLQPNLGTATIIGLIAFSMCFMAGIYWLYFAGVLATGAALVPVIYHFLHPYQQKRVMTFLNPEADPLGAGYNIIQSKIAIGSGGFWGKGLGQGSQGQLDFLPEKQTDFIFTMLGEELGFFGAMVLLVLYGFLLAYGLMLASQCRNMFGRMLAAGVCAMLFVHAFINMAMVMGMVPVVGVPLPFLSYGGSFLIAMLVAAGLLMHVDVNRDQTIHRSGGF